MRSASVAWLMLVALLVVAAPAAAKPLGTQQQVSFTDPLGDVITDSSSSAIAYGGGRSLIVWEQQNFEGEPDDESDETVVMGRFVNGAGGPISDSFKISDNPDTDDRELNPDVAYDSTRDRFLVVWDSEFLPEDLDRGGGRIIRGARVAPSGDVSPSVVLTPDDNSFRDPATAYGSTSDEFLVAYDDGGNVRARKVAAEDLTPQEDDVVVTDPESGVIAEGDPVPDVAFDAAAGRWLVVFEAFAFNVRGVPPDSTPEIYGRTYDASLNASELERISHGDPDDDNMFSRDPAAAADESGGGFMVVYEHWRFLPSLLPESEGLERQKGFFLYVSEVFARRVNGDGTLGGDAQEVSDPPDLTEIESEQDLLDALRSATQPDVWHDPNADQFLVTWKQDTRFADKINGGADRGRFEFPDEIIESEVFGRKIDNAGATLEDEQQISNHRPDGGVEFDGELPVVTYDRTVCDYVVSWTGEELSGAETEQKGEEDNEKREVWDRPYDAPSCPGAAVPPSAAAGEVAASRVCTSRRNFPIRLVKRRKRDYEFAVVKVNGTPVNVTYGDRVRSQVNLVGLPVGRYSVDIEARLENGRTLKGVRRYFTCNRKLPPSNGLDRPEAL